MEYLYPKLPESHLKDTIIKKIKRGEPLDHSLLIDLLYEGKYIYLLE